MKKNTAQMSEFSQYMKFDKRIFFQTLRQKIVFICVVALVATIVAGIWAKLAIGVTWRARTTIIRNIKNMAAQTDVPYLYQQIDLNTVLESVRMRRNLEEVIDSLGLKTTPEKLFGSFDVYRGGRSNILNIAAYDGNRDLAVDKANLLSEVFIRNFSEIMNSSARSMYHYYVPQREEYLRELNEVHRDIEIFQKQHGIMSVEAETEIKYSQINALELNRSESRLNIEALRTKIRDIETRLVDMPDEVQIGSLIRATDEKQLEQMERNLALYKEKYTDRNPRVIKLREDINAMKQKIEDKQDLKVIPDEISYGPSQLKQTLVASKIRFEYELKSEEELAGNYQQEIEAIKKELRSLSEMEKEYIELKRSEDLLTSLLQMIETRMVEAKIASESNIKDFEIIEYATPPKYPQGSRRKMMAIALGLFAFFGLLAYFMGKEYFDFSIKSDYDYDEFIDIPLMGEIPTQEDVPENVFYTQIQILFGKYVNLLPHTLPTFVTMGSVTRNTGKSFVIRELAEMLTSKGERVLWIDSIPSAPEEISQHVLNEALFECKKVPRPNKVSDLLYKSYFVYDEGSYRTVLDEQQLTVFFQQLQNYDVIIWELFEAQFNMQMFLTIANFSDMLTFVSRFRISHREILSNTTNFIKENSNVKINGILNHIKSPYFRTKY
ncbi:MAG: hypothetical protein K8S56_10630 [Candidatus Cloacimonetes bacterium]|nr:hypothetical protein [Candidatus Cloacimonadota bacterium]